MNRAAFGCVLAICLATAPAQARVTQDFTYAYTQIWQASIRLVRVDLGYRLVDRDQETGYLVFEYTEGGRTHSGTVEIVNATATRARVIVQIPSAPSYVERMIVDRLSRKLRDDFGDAPVPAPTPPSTPPEDNEVDDAQDNNANAPNNSQQPPRNSNGNSSGNGSQSPQDRDRNSSNSR